METSGALKLVIRFAGMCLLVPDPETRRFQALLPMVGSSGLRNVEDHEAVLLFDPRHDPGGEPTQGRRLRREPLSHAKLSFPALPETFDTSAIRRELRLRNIVDLTDLFSGEVARKWLDATPGGTPLHSRVEVPAGKAARTGPGGSWSLGGLPAQPMAVWTEWQVDLHHDELHVKLERQGTTSDITLRPIARSDTIKLYVYHAPEPEIPAVPPRDEAEDRAELEAPHFVSFFDLLNQTDIQPDDRIPRRRKMDVPEPHDLDTISATGSRVTCMLATAQAQSSPASA